MQTNQSVHHAVKIISDREREIFQIINFGIINNAICLFGVVANVMNIIVFYKQGFNSTINISFFGLAISDLCGLVTMLWYGLCINPLFMNSNVNMATFEIRYLTAGLPHICFARITGWITCFVTAERCLCIMIPLKIKQVITPKVTTVTISFIYAIIMASFMPEYGTIYIDWKFYSTRNRTLLGLVFTSNRSSVEGLVYILYSLFGSASFITVILFTVVLVVQLKKKSKWRVEANVVNNSSNSISTRERKTVTMVIMIAIVLIVCYAPGAAVSMVTFFEPEFSIIGFNNNAFFAFWSFAFVFDAINSSVNIFLYYNMSTKYRETFSQVFRIGTIQ